MRTIILIVSMLTFLAGELSAQTDFATLDRLNYQFYINKDYKNLKRTAKELLKQGNDYYYLRMRMGILAYENQRYATAFGNFTRAKQQNPYDTITNEYLYYSYYFTGRTADAKQFLRSIPETQKNNHLKALSLTEDPELGAGYTFMGYDVKKYQTNPLNFEAIENLSVFNASLTFNFTEKARGILLYTNTRKMATFYSPSTPTGEFGTYNQNQFYFRYKRILSTGWDLSGYTHWVFFTNQNSTGAYGRRGSAFSLSTESLFGIGLTYSGWYVRTTLNAYYSNFAKSNQLATECSLSIFPFSNLNLYSTLSGLYQYDENWGNTYQVNFDLGFKVFKYLWVESGAMAGNSFLYSRSFGSVLNNSFIIPATNIYGSLIIPTRKFSIRFGGNYSVINNYSWDLDNYIKTSKIELNSFGVNASLTIKIQ